MQSLKFQNRKIVHTADGENSDIIKALLAAVPEAINQSVNLAPLFLKKTKDPVEVARKVWTFAKTKIHYQVDEFGTQIIQLPSAVLHNKKADCKSLTLLVVSILANALPQIPIYIRFASYDPNNPTPTHVYCYIIVNGKQITVDPVYFGFDKEKKYFYNQDFNIMEISTVAGVEEIGKTKKKFFKKYKENVKSNFKKVKKVALAGPRGSFLVLVKINARGLAHKLERANSKQVEKIWNALGGNYKKLVEAVTKGAKKKAFLGEKINQVEGLEGIGSVVAISTMLVSAAGVLAAFAPILKSIEKSKGTKPGEPSTDDLTKEVTDAGGDLSIPKGEVKDPEEGSGKKASGGGMDFLSNPVVLGGGALAAYLLLKPKGRK